MTTALNASAPTTAKVEHPTRATPEPAITATTPDQPGQRSPAEDVPAGAAEDLAASAPEDLAAEVPVPVDQAGIDVLRTEIDEIDAELVRLILRRTAVSHAIGAARRSLGGPKIVYSREMAVLQRFRDLGPAGTDLGMMLLAMGRGKLGRK